MESVLDKFLRYVKINTISNPLEEIKQPSNDCEWDLINLLYEELTLKGLDVIKSDSGYLYTKIASNSQKDLPAICFISHVDTSFEESGKDVKPKIWENYDGNDLKLCDNVIISAKEYSELKKYIGKTIITASGDTLLGADDKAGIAEIMAFIDNVLQSEFEHGDICIAFTPDEEIGRGTDNFNLDYLGADFGYTVDGGELGELEYENFNASSMTIEVHGFNIHTGSAKGKMINAIRVIEEFDSMLPDNMRPETTSDYQGFYHLHQISGDVNFAKAQYLIREHNKELFMQKKAYCEKIVSKLNQKYGDNIVKLTIKDSYYNMSDIIKNNFHLVENAKQAMQIAGVECKVIPIRGGTDGAKLSYMGLPCPNLCTGANNFHSKYEYVVKESMEKVVEILLNIVKIYANNNFKEGKK